MSKDSFFALIDPDRVVVHCEHRQLTAELRQASIKFDSGYRGQVVSTTWDEDHIALAVDCWDGSGARSTVKLRWKKESPLWWPYEYWDKGELSLLFIRFTDNTPDPEWVTIKREKTNG